MPDPPATWMFCRACGYRSLFVAEMERDIECPQCHDHGRNKAIMRRQDITWTEKGDAK